MRLAKLIIFITFWIFVQSVNRQQKSDKNNSARKEISNHEKSYVLKRNLALLNSDASLSVKLDGNSSLPSFPGQIGQKQTKRKNKNRSGRGKTSNLNRNHKKRRKNRRKQRRRNRLKKGGRKRPKDNILEVTTAKNKNALILDVNNSSLDAIIEKLNKNPTMSYTSLISLTKKIVNDSSTPHFPVYSEWKQKNLHNTSTHKTSNDEKQNFSHTTINTAENTSNGFATDRSKVRNNLFTNINYADLLKTTTTTIAPAISNNVTLDVLQKEIENIDNELQLLFPNRKTITKYPGNRECNRDELGCAHTCDEKIPEKCACFPGFVLDSDSKNCLDVDECLEDKAHCHMSCHNTLGSFYCGCFDGFRLADDGMSCEDVNECLLRNGHGPCQGTCQNTLGSYRCECSGLPGTRLGRDNHSCEDVDECLTKKAGCSHSCINTLRSGFCTCPVGMVLGEDWKTCRDINECENPSIAKSCPHGCINTVGSYNCRNIEQNDQSENQNSTIPSAPDHVACPPLFPPTIGFYKCNRRRATPFRRKTKSGRIRITNRPGTRCELHCPMQYRKDEEHKLVCGVDGKWHGKRSGNCIRITPIMSEINTN